MLIRKKNNYLKKQKLKIVATDMQDGSGPNRGPVTENINKKLKVNLNSTLGRGMSRRYRRKNLSEKKVVIRRKVKNIVDLEPVNNELTGFHE
jgi:hypothetical protein